jgi:hypothetical protein
VNERSLKPIGKMARREEAEESLSNLFILTKDPFGLVKRGPLAGARGFAVGGKGWNALSCSCS